MPKKNDQKVEKWVVFLLSIFETTSICMAKGKTVSFIFCSRGRGGWRYCFISSLQDVKAWRSRAELDVVQVQEKVLYLEKILNPD